MLVLIRILYAVTVVGVLPVSIAAFLGSRCRWTALGFFAGWLMTPLLILLLLPLLMPFADRNSDGTAFITLPFLGLVTGVLAGAISALTISRRNGTSPSQIDPEQASR